MNFMKTSIIFVFLTFTIMNVTAQETRIKITINNETELTASMVENSSVAALMELLSEDYLTIEMSDYSNMEKVGLIGTTLPRNDEQITTEPGDLILYQGNALVIYYAPNSWNFTRLGKIDSITQQELIDVLGPGDVTVKLELMEPQSAIDDEIENDGRSQVFPNPVNNILEVELPFQSLTLLDTQGSIVKRTNQNTIDFNDIASGIYFLKIESENRETIVQKIIKN